MILACTGILLLPSVQIETNNPFRLDNTPKQVFKIALPIALSILVPQINFIVNNIFLGHLSQDALAVAGITGVYYLVFAVMGNGLVNGLQSILSRRGGENQPREMGNVYRHGLFIAVMFSVVGIGATFMFSKPILHAALSDSHHAEMAVEFLYKRIWGLPFLFLFQVHNVVLISSNKSKYILFGTIVETAANILLDYLLIFGWKGLAAMGFNGAAVASILAECAGTITVILVISSIQLHKKLFLWVRPVWQNDTLKCIFNQSLPLVLQYSISIISWEFFYILIEHHGSQALAISNVMRNLFGLFGCLIWGFASAANSMVSNIIGQGREKDVPALIKMIARLSISFTIILVLLLNLFPSLLMKAYGQDEAFVEAAIPVARIISVALLIMSVATIMMNSLVGMGQTSINLKIEILAIILYIIYVYLVLEHFYLSIILGWMSEWLYWIAQLVPAVWFISSDRWRGKKI